jgi:hypothetical protein
MGMVSIGCRGKPLLNAWKHSELFFSSDYEDSGFRGCEIGVQIISNSATRQFGDSSSIIEFSPPAERGEQKGTKEQMRACSRLCPASARQGVVVRTPPPFIRLYLVLFGFNHFYSL